MISNVHLVLRERGKRVTCRDSHNVLVEVGRTWLAKLISLGPGAVPVETRSLRYIGLGIGGRDQMMQATVRLPPLSTSYPVGYDPNGTTGFQYRDECPISPPISTLELPVRITGSNQPYPTALHGDEWLADTGPGGAYGGIITHPSIYSTSYRVFFDGALGHITYGAFASMPISEAGLYLMDVAPLTSQPYTLYLAAYVSFNTIQMTNVQTLEVFWHVRF